MSKLFKPENRRLFEELMVFREDIFYICLGFARNRLDAEELAQDVYLKAITKMETLRNAQLAKVWLFRICRNTCLDYAKRMRIKNLFEKPSESYLSELNTPESQIVHRQQLKSVKESIGHLPKKWREVFLLREYGDLSYQEIANILGIKKGTVMSRLNRARKAIVDMVKVRI